MSLPTTPEGWAIHLSLVVKQVNEYHKLPRFPIDVSEIARDYSRSVFPKNPITLIEGIALGSGFEGKLMPKPDDSGEWGIIYNSAITSKGRINFTLAHELGHYLLHRQHGAITCTPRDMREWRSEYSQREMQANTFASYLLMPLDDVRDQLKGKEISLPLMKNLAERYQVSLTAMILKWLSITDRRAMVVVGKDGFIDWAWCSTPLLRSGIYYRARQETTELPHLSLAAQGAEGREEADRLHGPGIWLGAEPVHEMCLFAPKAEMTLSLLMYPNHPPVSAPQNADDGVTVIRH
jgi:hypothetical protein